MNTVTPALSILPRFTVAAPRVRHVGEEVLVGNGKVQLFGRAPGPWTIAWYETEDSPRRRTSRATHKKAKALFDRKVTELRNLATGMQNLSMADAASSFRAQELLQPTGKTLELAAAETAECHQITGGRISPVEACRYWVARDPAGVESRPIPRIIEEWLAKQTMCTKHRRNSTHILESFASRFPGLFSDLQARAIEDWLSSPKRKDGSPICLRTRRNYLSLVKAVAGYARHRGYLDKDWRILDEVENPTPPRAAVNIYTPDELVRLLTFAETYKAGQKLVPFILCTSFAGIRHGEMNEEKIAALDWADFDWETRRIFIDGRAAKQTGRAAGDDRTVDMPDNLVASLLPYRLPRGRICILANTSNAFCRLRKKAGILGPKKNALRKSCITYSVAITRNIAAVADQVGNSPGMIRSNYKAAGHSRQREVAKAWFAIVHKRAGAHQLEFGLA